MTLAGDGAKWLWNRAEELRESLGLPEERFHEIVDYFHAVERLGTGGTRSAVGTGWRSRRSC